ncbi:hypothetical protein [Shewanella waksmanii]|uniref:hypothetical protein n=1 Tax=Shewanella waksmanii TaxID=213783 RepID=UPI003736789D
MKLSYLILPLLFCSSLYASGFAQNWTLINTPHSADYLVSDIPQYGPKNRHNQVAAQIQVHQKAGQLQLALQLQQPLPSKIDADHWQVQAQFDDTSTQSFKVSTSTNNLQLIALEPHQQLDLAQLLSHHRHLRLHLINSQSESQNRRESDSQYSFDIDISHIDAALAQLGNAFSAQS